MTPTWNPAAPFDRMISLMIHMETTDRSQGVSQAICFNKNLMTP